ESSVGARPGHGRRSSPGAPAGIQDQARAGSTAGPIPGPERAVVIADIALYIPILGAQVLARSFLELEPVPTRELDELAALDVLNRGSIGDRDRGPEPLAVNRDVLADVADLQLAEVA